MAYVLKISRRKFTGYAEECAHKNEEGHNAEGTGPACTGDCRWLESDTRELEDYGTETVEFGPDVDSYDWEEHDGNPVAWAAWYLSKNHPEITESSAGMTETFDAQWRGHVPEHAWLSGESEDAYDPEIRTETTVRAVGEFDTYTRSKVFALAVQPYDRMMKELRERT